MLTSRDRHYLQDVIEVLPTTILVVCGIVCISLGMAIGFAAGWIWRGYL